MTNKNSNDFLTDHILKQQQEKDKVKFTAEDFANITDINRVVEMYDKIKSYKEMVSQKMTFITPGLTRLVPYTKENLYLFGAFSGAGKTTVSANIAYPLWKEGKNILWISNEENKEDIQMRLACIELGYNFNDYKKGYMSNEKIIKAAKLFPEIHKHVNIVDISDKDGITTKVEGVMNILEEANRSGKYSCVLIDYYQLIKYSVDNPQRSTYQVLDDFRIFLMKFIKRSSIPVVLFCQLHSKQKRNNRELDSRIKDGPTIYEAATVIFEILPEFHKSSTDLVIHKDRFGSTGLRHKLGFENGRFIDYTEEFSRKVASKDVDEMEAVVSKRIEESKSNGA